MIGMELQIESNEVNNYVGGFLGAELLTENET